MKTKVSPSVILKLFVNCITASVGPNHLFSRKIRKSLQSLEMCIILLVMYPTKTDFMSLMDYSQGQSCWVSMSNLSNGLKSRKSKFKTESSNTARSRSDSTCWLYAKISRQKYSLILKQTQN